MTAGTLPHIGASRRAAKAPRGAAGCADGSVHVRPACTLRARMAQRGIDGRLRCRSGGDSNSKRGVISVISVISVIRPLRKWR